MSQEYLSLKSPILDLIYDQLEQVKQKNTLKLNNISQKLPDISLSEVIECVHEFIYSHQPALELERLSLSHNEIEGLPSNFPIISNNLRYLDLQDNKLTKLPEVLGEISQLEILNLSGNQLADLDSETMLKLRNLKVISIKENKFRYLPPVLGEISNLNLIEVGENPLISPSPEMIRNFQKQNQDLAWVQELKKFLVTNSVYLQKKLKEQDIHGYANSRGTDSSSSVLRSKSISETRSKSSKASRRMGLIIKKPSEMIGSKEKSDNKEETQSEDSFNLVLPQHPLSASASQTSFNIRTPPLTNSVSSTPHNNIPGSNSQHASPSSTPISQNASRQSGPRSRSNTLKELDRILEKNENVDIEHKSGAYFRRLSTLQELPIDEKNVGNNSSLSSTSSLAKTTPSTKGSSQQQPTKTKTVNTNQEENSRATTPAGSNSLSSVPTLTSSMSDLGKNESSQPKAQPTQSDPVSRKARIDNVSLIKVSRKVLFAFSELHSSIRRFTGFCADKRVTIKMVSLLYNSKSNIDSLVENLEYMEENGNNSDQIVNSLHICISSFKAITSLLLENFSLFVMKTDICFIRMLYLTVFGSFSEISNAFYITQNANKIQPGHLSNTNSGVNAQHPEKFVGGKSQLTLNTNFENNTEEIDEKLYQSIEYATSNAQTVFSELNKAISKTALATASNSATSSTQPMNHNLTTKIRELINVCMTSIDITKRLKTKLITIRNNPSQTTKKLFWDDINSFLKAVIQTFSSVKSVMKGLPILNDVRSHMATLTKATKDVTIMLEASSYRSISSDSSNSSTSSYAPAISSIPSLSNIFTPMSAHPNLQSTNPLAQMSVATPSTIQPSQTSVRTPLVATLGPAAQAILPTPSYNSTVNPHAPTSPGILNNGASVTAPPQSSGSYFAKNGINPFDGLILANRERAKSAVDHSDSET
ncbi:Piso0_000559 [Millerozyma farinosa CBS 7064]|uniref:Piso0_000559 protein n=1 Tax=Pichia sorbitophila (strain ATCC MYA-4447 / BCRC 22081 / CBS 7064 / NBRC 10061 / NRRL Y-12695) TaxID=559304 RepID=G8YVR9_PICSO|nr:Piso0_000559 [Millerozyma farinosa CBS 7064]CCE73513.1 Piso0_000559 [Millerozyma farinosa CBS 7064]